MKALSSWLFSSYIRLLFLFLGVQIFILGLGLFLSLDVYSTQQDQQLEQTARSILLNPDDPDIGGLGYSNPFFVFRADGTLIYTNRGQGRSIPEEDLYPVYYGDSVIGYWFAGETRFFDNRANSIFFAVLAVSLVISLAISLLLGLVFAKRSARRLEIPISLLQKDIEGLNNRILIAPRPMKIRELGAISQAVGEISRELVAQEEYKKRWMQDVAHDLRTPVAGLRGQLEAMRDGVLPMDSQRLDKNLLELSRLESMVQGIHDLYSLETLNQPNLTSFPWSRIRDELSHRFETQLRAKNQELLTISPDRGHSGSTPLPEDPIITGDYELIIRALTNLLSNAREYSNPGTRITLGLESQPEGWNIFVENLPAENPGSDLEKLFQRFYRGDFSRSTPGQGLGLNIAREIARRHGGDVSARKNPGGTLQFTLSLPQTPHPVPGHTPQG